MCGLVGIISKKEIDLNNLKRMNDEISHRGPNDEGYFYKGKSSNQYDINNLETLDGDGVDVALAHRRLSIIDLSFQGHQPMNYLDKYRIVFNGEIYNHIELREELSLHGYTFKSHTDTEVILAAYDHWGIECQNKFNGMWAIIIYNIIDEKIFISRDRFGIKPLYYYKDDETLVFASEVKSILEYEGVTCEPNVEYCKDYLSNGVKEYKRETSFKDIYRFDFASYIETDKNQLFVSDLGEKKFWDYEINTDNEKFDIKRAKSIAQEYYELLKDSIRLRLRADVPFGSALSGGLDSTSIVYLIEEELKNIKSDYKQQTFSTVHSGENIDCDESYYINLITNTLGIKSNKIEPNPDEIEDLHELVVKHWENPFEGTGMSGINTYKLINDSNVVVTLDGQGADEQQAGYLFYIINLLYNLDFMDALSEGKKLYSIPKAKRFVKMGLLFNFSRQILSKKLFEKIAGKFRNGKLKKYIMPLNEKLKNDTNEGLINLIHYSDSRSMLYSIESRMPFMDYRLVEFTAKIPAVYKIHNGWTKYFARLAFDKKLPDEICWRKDKMGWPMPDKKWFSGPLNDWITGSVNNSDFIQEHIKKIDIKKDMETFGMKKSIRLLNLASWHNLFFEKK